MHIAIKSRWSEAVLFEGEFASMKECVQAAVKKKANLQGASLRGANLQGADLQGASLRGANLQGADLRGEKLVISPLLIFGLRWEVTITGEFMKIGCERHTHLDWSSFGRDRIAQMSVRAWDWWKEHKEILMGLCELHRKEVDKSKSEQNKEVA